MRVVLAGVLLGTVLSVPAQGAARVVPEAPGCGGHALVVTPGHAACVHSDRYDRPAAAPWAGVRPAAAPVRCYGDGTTGPRLQLLYGYVAGHRDNGASVARMLRTATASRMQAVVDAASGGKDLGIRFAFDPGCAGLSVPTVRLPAAADRGTPDERFGVVIEALRALGYTRTDRKYQMILDGVTHDGVCGLGELAPMLDQPHPVNAHDGIPTVGARTDPLSAAGAADLAPVPRYSVVFRSTYGPRGPSCWELGQSRASVQLHELFHTLGAVQLSAPHSDGGGHCTDTPSIMCATRGKPTVRACANRPVEVLDCGLDDYWNPAPPSGSYLESGDNLATSVFFGPQPQDALAFSPV
ncbi:MAG TPA: hypothetical protein VM097_08970 [Mycobacteriales bacterium]|nr:hypothetical protein [Mycobacteriales bacterium]